MSRDFNPRASGSTIRLRFGCPGTLVQGKQPAETVMRRITSFSISAAVYASLWVVTTSASWGQDLKEAEVLNRKVIELYNAGQYAEALPLAQRALSIREKELGPDDPDLASSLENLAALYSTQERYADAEPLYKRSLAIRERILGPEDPGLAPSLNDLALIYYREPRRILDLSSA
jgi:tetratricopeptide (TPR) repeat protein